jgi:Zn-dependent peptidase ImmA (M78 family)
LRHIHIRASDPVDNQAFTVLHELKHIIDHPLRRRATEFSSVDWEALANHFAMRVLTLSPRQVVTRKGGVIHE